MLAERTAGLTAALPMAGTVLLLCHGFTWLRVHPHVVLNECVERQLLTGELKFELFDAARERSIPVALSLPSAGSPPAPLLVYGPGTGESLDNHHWISAVDRLAIVRVQPWHDPVYHACEYTVDMTFVAEELIRQAGEDELSPVHGRLSGQVVFGGHSMGGGSAINAAVLAPEGMAVGGYVGLGLDVFTTPWDAAKKLTAPNLTVPALIVSGTRDCFTPIPWNSAPLFELLSHSPRKAHVVLIGGHVHVHTCHVPIGWLVSMTARMHTAQCRRHAGTTCTRHARHASAGGDHDHEITTCAPDILSTVHIPHEP